ncbi:MULTISPECIES: hypothetical protein [unclassified Actinopolyspora]|uniref:hypothetical protein n=1 Tax=unclassified Actinopolyspora TaxID=2639451 RepID=UPI0013F699AF|nr:hypothetical protein [Actinopolyspora sp. BKK2]NHE77993.1 hypothetical protein [Actinopolyspora sp. BKK1]
MKGRLVSPRWVLLHLVFLAAVVAAGWLGWWQWERAHEAGGSFQNLGYALQWPLFGGFALFLWYQVVRALNGTEPHEEAEPVGESAAPEETDSSTSERSRSRRSPVPPPAPPVTEEEDPQLAEYNRYLAELNASRSE